MLDGAVAPSRGSALFQFFSAVATRIGSGAHWNHSDLCSLRDETRRERDFPLHILDVLRNVSSVRAHARIVATTPGALAFACAVIAVVPPVELDRSVSEQWGALSAPLYALFQGPVTPTVRRLERAALELWANCAEDVYLTACSAAAVPHIAIRVLSRDADVALTALRTLEALSRVEENESKLFFAVEPYVLKRVVELCASSNERVRGVALCVLVNFSNFGGHAKQRIAAVRAAVRTLVSFATPGRWSRDVSEKALRTLYHLALEPATHLYFEPYMAHLVELAHENTPMHMHLIDELKQIVAQLI